MLVLAFLGGLAVALGWFAASTWHRGSNAPAAHRAVPGEWLPAADKLPKRADLRFRLPSLDGRQLGPPDYHGKIVIVDFWATWCLPCHLQAEVLQAVHRDHGEQVQVLAVDLGEPEEVVREFAARKPYPYPVLLDPGDTLSPRFGISVLPTVMVLDRDGRLVYLRAGIADRRTLDEVLRAAGL